MTRVKIIAISDAKDAKYTFGTGSYPCADSAYIGRIGKHTGGTVANYPTGEPIYKLVEFENGERFLFKPDQLEEIAE